MAWHERGEKVKSRVILIPHQVTTHQIFFVLPLALLTRHLRIRLRPNKIHFNSNSSDQNPRLVLESLIRSPPPPPKNKRRIDVGSILPGVVLRGLRMRRLQDRRIGNQPPFRQDRLLRPLRLLPCRRLDPPRGRRSSHGITSL